MVVQPAAFTYDPKQTPSTDAGEGNVDQKNIFNKTQTAEINGTFSFGSAGVANMNSAAGNMQSQTAYTTIGVAFVK